MCVRSTPGQIHNAQTSNNWFLAIFRDTLKITSLHSLKSIHNIHKIKLRQ